MSIYFAAVAAWEAELRPGAIDVVADAAEKSEAGQEIAEIKREITNTGLQEPGKALAPLRQAQTQPNRRQHWRQPGG